MTVLSRGTAPRPAMTAPPKGDDPQSPPAPPADVAGGEPGAGGGRHPAGQRGPGV